MGNHDTKVYFHNHDTNIRKIGSEDSQAQRWMFFNTQSRVTESRHIHKYIYLSADYDGGL